MDPTTLTEWGPAQEVDLPTGIAHALRQRGIVDVTPTEHSGRWELRARRWVGVITVSHLGERWQLTIQPKLPIDRIAFLLGYARNPHFWTTERVQIESASGLPEALARAFGRVATECLAQGVLMGYRTVDESLQVLRGRVREADQVRRRWGLGLPLEVHYDDFTVDIAENQILLAATLALLRTAAVSATHRPALHRLRLLLADVTPLPRGRPRPAWRSSRLNTGYGPALALAELVLDCQSFHHRHGDVEMTGFMVDMDKVFEDFVCVGLREALRPRQTHLQYRTHLDTGRQVPMRPDFVWTEHGRPKVVADAKYKSDDGGNPDLYQMFAYCSRLEVPTGHIVNAGGAPSTPYELPGGVRVFAHSLTLDGSPAELLNQLESIGDHMCASAFHMTASDERTGHG
ncbi:restriction endonuclease [Naumannella sp. ID2617S]|nr:restriction endonuclease [Naumannella sp. ID2617S]